MAVTHGGVPMSHRQKGPVSLPPKVAANDTIIITDLDAELALVRPKVWCLVFVPLMYT
jgi:hypothetical protein